MKKLIILVFFSLSLAGCSSESSGFTDGTYSGSGEGMGEITATVTIEDGELTAVEFTGDGETEGVSDPAFEEMAEKFVEAQSSDVETVSGASVTSKGMIEAVEDALSQAK